MPLVLLPFLGSGLVPTGSMPKDQPPFHAFSYALDLLMPIPLPIPLFGQREHWVPAGWTLWLSYALIASGWILVTALIAGVTRVLRPD